MRPKDSRFLTARTVAVVCLGVATIAMAAWREPRRTASAGPADGGRIPSPEPQQIRQRITREMVDQVRRLGIPLGLTLAEGRPIAMGAGEIQSTVVRPGVKPQCPRGRLLISDDSSKNAGRIALVDLDQLDAAPAFTQVALPPLATAVVRSNDHDLVSLPAGDVLLVKMGRLRSAIGPKPVWFDYTYKLGELYGPGARSALFVWRSEDCGTTFDFVSTLDTGRIDDGYGSASDGSGGFPQRSQSTDPPGSATQPIWGMGGTDGPLVKVDPRTGHVFATIGLYGYVPSSTKPFMVGTYALNRTVVMMSTDKGVTWQRVASLPFRGWRVDIVPRANNRMAFAHNAWKTEANHGVAFVIPSYPISSGADPGAVEAPEPQGRWGWDRLPWEHPVLYKRSAEKDSTDYMQVNVAGQTILSRSPNSTNLLLAYMDTLGDSGDGYRLYRLDQQLGWLPFRPIAPRGARDDDFVLHLTAVDPGRGPMLLYWYDVDTVMKEAAIRGRLVTGEDQETMDFVISRSGSRPRSFDVTMKGRWYGDYHTAGGYSTRTRSDDVYHYFPIWVEPDLRVHVAHLEYRIPAEFPRERLTDLGYSMVFDRDKIVLRRPVDFSTLAVEETPDEEARPGGDL